MLKLEASVSTAEQAGERGHLMAGVMVLLAIMLIFSTVIFQSWDQVLRRDNEAEMIFRAQEIVRAMVRYRKDHGTTPAELEELMEPGKKAQFYLRQLYKDPLVKNGKWGLLYLGPGGEIIDPNAEEGMPGADALGLGGPGRGTGLGQRPTGLGRDRRSGGNTGRADPRRFESELKPSAAGGRQLAGMRLAGVKSLCSEKPFRVYKGQTDYAQWLFTILDLDQPQVPGQQGGRNRRGQQAGPGRRGPDQDRTGGRQGRGQSGGRRRDPRRGSGGSR